MATKRDELGSTPYEYWSSGAGMVHLTPPGERWPEGAPPEFTGFLRGLVGDGMVLEFGCGDGRLAPAFAPESYLGMDICAEAIDAALQDNPGYRFVHIKGRPAMPPRDAVLAHTVLLHIPDDEILEVIGWLCRIAPKVVVSEILGRHWRREGDPPVFNREESDYEALFRDHGYHRAMTAVLPIARYGAFMSFMDFRQR